MISNAEYFAQDQDLTDAYAAGELTRAAYIAARTALADQWAVPATLAATVVDFTAEQRTVLDQIGLLNLTGAVANVGDLPGGAANGDTYLVNNNGHAYLRLTGVWKDLGPYGGRGGVAMFTVEGVPAGSLGVAGDLALDLETGDFYGPKTSSGWGEPVVATGLQAKVIAANAARDAARDARDETLVLLDFAGAIGAKPITDETDEVVGAFIDKTSRRAALLIRKSGAVEAPLLVVPPSSVGVSALQTDVTDRLAGALSNAGYAFALFDPSSRRVAFAIKEDGSTVIPRQEAVNVPGMSLIQRTDSGYLMAWADPATGRVALGIRSDGTVEISKLVAPGLIETITVGMLDLELRRLVRPSLDHLVEARPDPLRCVEAPYAVSTSVTGHRWTPLPPTATPAIRGLNNTGVTLEFRRRSGLRLPGVRLVGTFDPGALESVTYRGDFTDYGTFPPPATYADGDYLRYIAGWGNGTPRTIGSDTYEVGDLAVYDGSVWARQAAPTSSLREGDFWTVTADGIFDGMSLTAGNRLLFYGAAVLFKRWALGRAGDYFLKGEWAPGAGFPASPANGDAWQVTAPGTETGLAVADGDYLVRVSGAWGVVRTEPKRSATAGEYIHLPCVQNADEWEVRRADKSASVVTLIANCDRQSDPVFPAETGIVCYSGSSGQQLLAPGLAAFSPRPYAAQYLWSGTSLEILQKMQADIARGDPYRGWLHLFYVGGNNVYFPEYSLEAMLRATKLLGVHQRRFVLMNFIGRREMFYSSGENRLYVREQEQQLQRSGTGLDKLRDYYKAMWPGQWFDTWAEAGALVTSELPDLTFPGMTELEVWETYGALPFSWWMDYSNKDWEPADLNFVGYRSAAGLPTGGSDLDYYLRSGNGIIGNLIVKEAGTWVEHTDDFTHMRTNGQGPGIVIQAVKSFIETKGW